MDSFHFTSFFRLDFLKFSRPIAMCHFTKKAVCLLFKTIILSLFKGQCGRDFPASKDSFQLPTGSAGTGNGGGGASSSILAASNAVTAMEAPDDVNSDHDIDTEQESSLSEVICPNGRHKWKHDQCLVCTVCGECTGNNFDCFLFSRN